LRLYVQQQKNQDGRKLYCHLQALRIFLLLSPLERSLLWNRVPASWSR
jgi:hypothetical protein